MTDKGIIRTTAIGTATAAAAVLGVTALRDARRFVVRRYTVVSEKLNKDIRIVLLADLHDQVYGRHNDVLLAAIDREHPDLVLSAGDLITAHHNPAKQRGEEATALIMTLGCRYPTLLINGNHETKLDTWRDLYDTWYDDYEKMVHSTGAVLLRNERAVFSDWGISVDGLELPLEWFRHFRSEIPSVREIQKRLGTPEDDTFRILLAHHPDYFASYRAWGADLTLSGHIHGGVVRLPFIGGIVSPTGRLFPKYDGGLFTEENKTMILSRGLGMHTIPVRIFNPGELVVIDCVRGAEKRGRRKHHGA